MELYSKSVLEYSDVLLIFYIPLIDGLRVTFTRVYKGINPFKGDLTHIHHLIRKNKFLIYFYFALVFIPSMINFFYKDFTILIALLSGIVFLTFYIFVNKINNN